jgi:hypothetical protein
MTPAASSAGGKPVDDVPFYFDDQPEPTHPGCFLEAVAWLVIVAYWIVVGFSWLLIVCWVIVIGQAISDAVR